MPVVGVGHSLTHMSLTSSRYSPGGQTHPGAQTSGHIGLGFVHVASHIPPHSLYSCPGISQAIKI